MIAKRTPTKVFIKYANFADVFSPDLVSKLPKQTGINDYTIKLVNTNGVIRPFKSPTGAPIFFDLKSDRSFSLYNNYRDSYNVSDHIGFDSQNNYNSPNSLNGHNRSYALKQARKSLILPRNLFVS